MQIEFGNAGDVDTGGTGWFVGFSPWARNTTAGVDLRYLPQDRLSHTLCMKWMTHAAGDPRGVAKPISEGRTLSVLVSTSGLFRLQFSDNDRFESNVVEHVLCRHGDFSVWGAGVFHRYVVDDTSTILTLRWIPLPDDEGGAGSPGDTP